MFANNWSKKKLATSPEFYNFTQRAVHRPSFCSLKIMWSKNVVFLS